MNQAKNDQVHQDLTNTDRIHHDLRRKRADCFQLEGHAQLAGSWTKGRGDFERDLPWRIRDQVQFRPSGLDLGKVEDVVDELKQVGPIPPDSLQGRVAVGSGEPGIQQDLGVAKDGRHGCPDFMAHVGEERRLCLGGGQCLVASGFQLRCRNP